eukprot:CAMPEP_0184861816 /NCGR_PEP_ID=MMETSP0580-20130426/6421_1 /TAXON_ID=1118495 /ORGANISM="Dactyliosolen fragilissimus" /LENGTH=1072 /DNA_ID=CAMNT_0027359455 /DNA_START=251 /DNA_END=3469 /DNA_ORIENTATION=+
MKPPSSIYSEAKNDHSWDATSQPVTKKFLGKESNKNSIQFAPNKSSYVDTEENASNTLSKCIDIMEQIMNRREILPFVSKDGLACEINEHEKRNLQPDDIETLMKLRRELLNDAAKLLSILKLSIKVGRINSSSGKNTHDLSALIGNILLICAESPQEQTEYRKNEFSENKLPNPSPYEVATEAFELLREINIDIQPIHYALAIQTSCNHSMWEMASSLFLNQIDAEMGGWVPMDATLGTDKPVEMGLYAIAMMIKENSNEIYEVVRNNLNTDSSKGSISEAMTDEVFTAIEKMCIVSPTDEERYLLAAGCALGRAGEWKVCVDYSRKNENKSKFGQPLTAAAMYASFICGKYDIVVELYKELIENNPLTDNTEWSWASGHKSTHPLCRDLFLRSLSLSTLFKSDDEQDQLLGMAKRTLDLIVEEESVISIDGLQGLFRVFERCSSFSDAMNLFDLVIRHQLQNKNEWKIVSSSFENFVSDLNNNSDDYSNTIKYDEVSEAQVYGKMLSCVMNACNEAEEFGLALVYGRSMNTFLESRSLMELDSKNSSSFVDIHLQPLLYQEQEYLNATITALCNLGCVDEASLIHSEVCEIRNKHDLPIWDVENNVLKESSRNSTQINSSWMHAWVQIESLLRILDQSDEESIKLDSKDMYKLSLHTAKMMECSTDAGQAIASLYFAQLILPSLKKNKMLMPSGDKFIDFLLSLTSRQDETESMTVSEPDITVNKLYLSDEVLFSAMKSLQCLGEISAALQLYYSRPKFDDELPTKNKSKGRDREWIKSTNFALSLILEENLDDGVRFYGEINDSVCTPETYLLVAQSYAKRNRFDDVSRIYVKATESGCLSEALGIIAMQGIVKKKVNGKIKILRTVVDDISKMIGVESDEWIALNYWELKKLLGFHYARMLMWWKNPKETQGNELKLAIKQLQTHKKFGSVLKDDALKCIVTLAGYGIKSNKYAIKEHHVAQNEDEKFWNEKRKNAIEMIFEAISEAQLCTLHADPQFIIQTAFALRDLGANNECIKFLNTNIALDVNIPSEALNEGIIAAESIDDYDTVAIFEKMQGSNIDLETVFT